MNYIGSKFSILDYIDKTIEDFIKPKDKNLIFCDIFSGTASVGKYFKNKGYSIISNDIQSYGATIAKHFIENNEELKFEKLKNNGIDNPFDYLESIKPIKGFIYKNYTMDGTKGKAYERQYFTSENAMKIDSIRIEIGNWLSKKWISLAEYNYLLVSLLESADKIANTASVYEAFLKKVKTSAQKKMIYKPVETFVVNKNQKYEVKNMDANELVKEIKGDILYMDPPYNSRKYDTNYHLLETITLYDEPVIKGKTGIRTDETKKSKYCMKKEASTSFENLVKDAKFKYLFLSYNNEGIISLDTIEKIMSKYGKYRRYEQKHRRFKADSKRDYTNDYTIEYIHCLEKDI